MAQLPTLGILSITDGRLMGDIGDVYTVVSFFIGRSAYTHELSRYGRRAEPMLIKEFPDLAADRDSEWKSVRDAAIKTHGDAVEVPDEWNGILADGKNAVETLIDAADERDEKEPS